MLLWLLLLPGEHAHDAADHLLADEGVGGAVQDAATAADVTVGGSAEAAAQVTELAFHKHL